jgi:protein-S-isoprenylcysteine O-methyltransferase Ste14
MQNRVEHVEMAPDPQNLLLVLLVVGLLLGWVSPAPFLPNNVGHLVGVATVAVALSIGGSALMTLRRAHTSPNPNRPTVALVESGVFRYSRNPIYLSMFLLYLGITAFVNVVWLLLLIPIWFLSVNYSVVRREEKYLERKFGDAYMRYKAHVRRWI